MGETVFLLLLFGIPAAVGFRLAVTRGKNPLLWGVLSGVFPFFLMVLYFHKPNREIPGHFRKCDNCGRTFPWKDSVCRYCQTEQKIEVI